MAGATPFWVPHDTGKLVDLEETLASRDALIRSRPFEAFKAVGVSFNDVQTTLGTMNQGA